MTPSRSGSKLPDPKTRRLYVVELHESAGPRHRARFCNLYVGETGASVAERLAVHLSGGLYARKVVTEHYRRLRPDLYAGLPATTDRAESERAERKLAEFLRDLGYRVYTNGGWLPKARGRKQLDLTELRPAQLAWLGAAVCRIRAGLERELKPAVCAHVLWGSRGAQIASWGARELDDFGRFAHVRHPALTNLVADLG